MIVQAKEACQKPLVATLSDLTFPKLQQAMRDGGVNPVHALAVFQRHHLGVEKKTSAAVEEWLAQQEIIEPVQSRCTESSDGWTRKYLLKLADDREIESVLMGYSRRHTGCLSTQVGCAMGCVFCATGQMGFRRHLTTGEIVAQVHFLNARLKERGEEPLRNLVMMGMGEPLHNFDATISALDILTDTKGLKIAPSRVSISTVGHVPGILKLAEVEKSYGLSISLHGATDEERGALIPVNKRWPLDVLLDACRAYSEKKSQRVIIAWTLIDGVNDSDDHARRLAHLLKGMNVHLNLIPLNPTDGYGQGTPTDERVQAFQTTFRDLSGLPATVRQRRGIDVGAGCGQLAS